MVGAQAPGDLADDRYPHAQPLAARSGRSTVAQREEDAALMERALAGKRKFIVSPEMAPGSLDLRVFARDRTAAAKSKKEEK